MKQLLLLIFTTTQLLLSATLEHISIGNQDFSMVTETYKMYDSKGEVMKLYKEERNNDLTFVLSLILKDATGSCSDKSIEEGAYEINGTQVILYSFWDRRGKAYDSPYGARIQRYELLPDHTLKLVSSRIYIETERQNYNDDSGMKYLFTAPQTEAQKEALKAYVASVERIYKSTFVYDEEAKKLMEEVQEALRRKTKSRWK